MRPAPGVLLVALAPPLAGCAQVLGIEDPVAEHELKDDVDADFLLTIDASSVFSAGARFQFVVGVEPDLAARELDTTWHALRHATTDPDDRVGDAVDYDDLFVENQPELDFAITGFSLDVDAMATADDRMVRIVSATVAAKWPLLGGATATTSAFCGTIDGQVSVPVEQAASFTFAAIQIEDGATLPATPAASCDELP